jgi:parallel beta-helix repeat protein
VLELEDRRLLATLLVTNTRASGAGSLASAINTANKNKQANTIIFSGLTWNTPQTITGGRVSGNTYATGAGGGLLNYGTLTLTNCTVSGNSATEGGGLWNDGTAMLAGGTASGNSASFRGGGVYANAGTTSLYNTVVSGNSANYGGGLLNFATLLLKGCTVSGNSANDGGGLEIYSTAALTNCTISGNVASSNGGGINDYKATATLAGCTLSGNSAYDGGGAFNYGTNAKLTLTNCTVSGNNAESGGGIDNRTKATLTNCTVSGNSSTSGNGGGLENSSGTTTISNTIVAGNNATASGPDAYNPSSAPFTSTGHNLIGNTSGSTGWSTSDLTNTSALLASLGNYGGTTQTVGLFAGSPAINAGALTALASLSAAVNASATQFSVTSALPFAPGMLLSIDSEVVSVVSANFTANTLTVQRAVSGTTAAAHLNGAGLFLDTDQRGLARNVNGAVDIGAFEAQPALVPSYTVNTTSDEIDFSNSTTSLREAIASANAFPGHNVTFDSTVFGTAQTITLTGGQLTLSAPSGTETIIGPAAGVTINGNNASRVFEINPGVMASISGMTITGGKVSGYAYAIGSGGGLRVYGTLALNNCTISGNSATHGGALWNDGTATLTGCTISGNTATDNGGGIYTYAGTTSLYNSTVSGNHAHYGGGLINFATTVLKGCTVSGNSARYGGGLWTDMLATLTGCAVSSNVTSINGGGINNYYYGTANLTNCTVSGNSAQNGGGLMNYATATLTGCTVSGNSARNGGGVWNNTTATLTSSTLYGNSATNYGGGLWNNATATLANCTVSGNSAQNGGGGLWSNGSPTPTTNVGNTIVAGNTGTTNGPDASGIFVSKDHNLIGESDGSQGWSTASPYFDQLGSIAKPTVALLAHLGNYGGPTPTLALLPGSPAIDAGLTTGAPASDQRGEGRVNAVDIGAFESQGFTIAATSGSGQSTKISTQFSAPLVATVTATNPSEPVVGGMVTFNAPLVLQSANITGSPATIGITGTASVTATANALSGSYTVTATATGVTPPAAFSLSNGLTSVAGVVVGTTLQNSTYGQSVSFTVTINPPSGGPTPTGTAQFVVDGSNFGSPVTLSGGQATSPAISNLSATTHTVSANYSGDSNYAPAVSGNFTQTVTKAHLAVVPDNLNRPVAQTNPTLTVHFTGFQLGENATSANITGSPNLTTTATTASPIGTYPITVTSAASLSAANYDFPATSFGTGTLTVTQGTVAGVVVGTTLQNSTYGQSLSFTVSVNPPSGGPTPTGAVQFVVDGTNLGSPVILSGGQATSIAVSNLSATAHTVSANYSADSNYAAASGSFTQTVTKAHLTVTADDKAMLDGGPLPSLTATITGFVNSDTVAVVSGAAALSTTATASSHVGMYPINVAVGTLTATNYDFPAANLIAGTLTVNPTVPAPVNPSVEVSVAGGVYNGSAFAASATITPNDGPPNNALQGVGITLTYYAGTGTGGTKLGSTPPTNAGTYTVVAAFPGSADASASASAPVTFTIAPATPSVALSSSGSSAVYGQPVTVTATLTTAAGTPGGSIGFLDGSTLLATVPLGSGQAQATLTLPQMTIGNHSITAVYSGSPDFQGATSGPASESIAKAPTQLVLVPNPVLKGKKVISLNLTATVAPMAPGAGVPSGTLALELMLKQGKKTKTVLLGMPGLNQGKATIALKPSQVLKKTITVIYNGDPDFQSTKVAQTLQ